MKTCVNLKAVSVSNSWRPFDSTRNIEDMLKSVTSVVQSLKRISIKVNTNNYGAHQNYAEINPNLIDGFKNIETLELSGRALHLCDQFFEAVGKNCHNLTRIHLHGKQKSCHIYFKNISIALLYT